MKRKINVHAYIRELFSNVIKTNKTTHNNSWKLGNIKTNNNNFNCV
jgi:hypothetical protein